VYSQVEQGQSFCQQNQRYRTGCILRWNRDKAFVNRTNDIVQGLFWNRDSQVARKSIFSKHSKVSGNCRGACISNQQGCLQQPGFNQQQRILENAVTISTAAKKIYISKVHSNSKVPPSIRLQETAGRQKQKGRQQQKGWCNSRDASNSRDACEHGR
jgi:hypothetical protein